jgi:hypothetical protein
MKKKRSKQGGQKVVLCKGGTQEKTVDAKDIDIPDLWPIAERLGVKTPDGEAVILCWHLCHALLAHVRNG